MDHSEPPPAIQEFLDKALPKHGGTHTLVLGEAHNDPEHLDFLGTHLDLLQTQHHVWTIGIERDALLSPFLWAYQDGSLLRALGSEEAVKKYMHNIFRVAAPEEYLKNAWAKADLAMAAMDRGIRVVAYDCREAAEIPGLLGIYMKNPDWGMGLLQAWHDSSGHSITRDRLQLYMETARLLSAHPEYRKKLQTLEDLMALGHKKIEEGKLTSDALNAVLFEAQALPGNRMTLAGFGHIQGMDSTNTIPPLYSTDVVLPQNHPNHVHGTFGHHLFAVGQPKDTQRSHTLTRAVLGTTATIGKIMDNHQSKIVGPDIRIVADQPISLVDMEQGNVRDFSYLPTDEQGAQVLHEAGFHTLASFAEPKNPAAIRYVPLAEKFLPPKRDAPCDQRVLHYKQHINPLLMPDIKRASDAVRETMNGPQTHLSPS